LLSDVYESWRIVREALGEPYLIDFPQLTSFALFSLQPQRQKSEFLGRGQTKDRTLYFEL